MLLRLTLASFLIATASAARADVTHLLCTQTGSNTYRLSYTFTGDTHQVQILAGSDAQPSSADMKPLLKTSQTSITVHTGKPGQRIYFFLRTNTGEQREVSIRHLPLQGTPNFRDLGGYETTDRRFVKWGLIYRSGLLTYLTPADYQYLSQIGIRVVCDFRTEKENKAAPETWIPGSNVQHLSLPIGGDNQNKDADAGLAQILKTNPTPDQLRAWITHTYSNFAFSAAPQYAHLFHQLEHDSLPLLYHCTAGKDRTGVFSAFLLLTLGVPEKTVLEDYALTNRYLLHGNPRDLRKMSNASGDNSINKLNPEQQKVLIAADPAYLRSTLRAIDARYGSFENYRRQQLHVSDADVQALRSRLLTH